MARGRRAKARGWVQLNALAYLSARCALRRGRDGVNEALDVPVGAEDSRSIPHTAASLLAPCCGSQLARSPLPFTIADMGSHLTAVTLAWVGWIALGCSSDAAPAANAANAQPALSGTTFGKPFTARDTLLVHPQSWKSADAGSTAILLSDTPDLCNQITSGKTIAPGSLVIVSLQENAADGSVVDLEVGSFVAHGQGTASAKYGEVFVSGVDAQCGFDKLFSDQSSIQITSVGPKSSPVSAAIDVHFTSGDSLQGDISAASGCDEAAVDAYLNRNPKCD